MGVNFEVVGATLNIEGGTVGDGSAAAFSTVNISGGNLGNDFEAESGSVINVVGGDAGVRFKANSGSVVNISDGNIGFRFDARSGSAVNISGGATSDIRAVSSEINISGGTVGTSFNEDHSFSDGSVVNITGGSIGGSIQTFDSEVNISGGSFGSSNNFFIAHSGSVVNISGGSFEGRLEARVFSEVNLFGSDFVVNGVPLDSLTIDEAFTIDTRFGQLTGRYADGSQFSLDLNQNGAFLEDEFDTRATLTVTQVAPALNTILGDVDQDGAVTFADIPSFIEALTAGVFLEQADCNQDGEVNFADIPAFIEIITAF